MWEGEACLLDQFMSPFFCFNDLFVIIVVVSLSVCMCVSLCMCGVFENSFVQLILPFTFTWVLRLKLR